MPFENSVKMWIDWKVVVDGGWLVLGFCGFRKYVCLGRDVTK